MEPIGEIFTFLSMSAFLSISPLCQETTFILGLPTEIGTKYLGHPPKNFWKSFQNVCMKSNLNDLNDKDKYIHMKYTDKTTQM